MTTDDQYLWAWKNSGMSDEVIAARLSIQASEVSARYDRIVIAFQNQDAIGIDNLISQFNTTCLQYQLLGEGLKVLGANLSRPVTPQEIKDKIKEDPDATVRSLMKSFIILHPWQDPKIE